VFSDSADFNHPRCAFKQHFPASHQAARGLVLGTVLRSTYTANEEITVPDNAAHHHLVGADGTCEIGFFWPVVSAHDCPE
jgi:hypothetical protein